MKHRDILSSVRHVAIALAATVAITGTALAAEGGHGGGGGGRGGGVGGGHAFAGGRGAPGHFGGYGYRGGGWRGGYGYYGPWGWGGYGFGYGLFLATLPLYYSTYWWNGMPYYYADSNYYQWNGTAGGYESVAPPPELAAQGPQGAGATELFAYPKSGQSTQQQAQDKFECHRWARDQTGFDPTQAGGAAAGPPGSAAGAVAAATPPPGAAPGNRQDYLRAQTACLEARGYSVR
jgi:hypothetical protein